MSELILRLERIERVERNERADTAERTDRRERRARHVVDLGNDNRVAVASTPLARWSAAVAAAHDACVVLDRDGQVLSMSAAAAELFGCSDIGVIGRPLLDVVEVVDFDSGIANPDYAARVAPLAVLANGSGLMRSLMRVRRRDSVRVTLDVSAAPIHDGARWTVGSISFLAPVHG